MSSKIAGVKIIQGGISSLPKIDTKNQIGIAHKVRYSKDYSNEYKVIESVKGFRDKELAPYLKYKEAIISHKKHSRFSFVVLIYE